MLTIMTVFTQWLGRKKWLFRICTTLMLCILFFYWILLPIINDFFSNPENVSMMIEMLEPPHGQSREISYKYYQDISNTKLVRIFFETSRGSLRNSIVELFTVLDRALIYGEVKK